MHRNKSEKNRDNLIGEAVLFLMQTHGYVESYALAGRLKAMADEECDYSRKMALIEASKWVIEKDTGQILSVQSGLNRTYLSSVDCVEVHMNKRPQKKH